MVILKRMVILRVRLSTEKKYFGDDEKRRLLDRQFLMLKRSSVFLPCLDFFCVFRFPASVVGFRKLVIHSLWNARSTGQDFILKINFLVIYSF